jgi:hypothetical protein
MPAVDPTFYSGVAESVNIQLPVAEENFYARTIVDIAQTRRDESEYVLRPSEPMHSEVLNHGSASTTFSRATPAVRARGDGMSAVPQRYFDPA